MKGMTLIFVVVFILSLSSVLADSINYNSPTPNNNTFYTTQPQNISINATIDIASALQNFSYRFNSTTYTFLDSTTKLFMPLDNVLQSSSNKTLDYSQYLNNGTASGYTLNDGTRQGGQSGIIFDGINDLINLTGAPMQYNYTICIWANGTGTLASFNSTTSRPTVAIANNKTLMYFANTIYKYGTTVGVAFVKHQFCFVYNYNASTSKAYIDGTLDGAGIQEFTGNPFPIDSFRIGKDGTNAWFNGTIYKVTIHNRELNTTEITQDLNTGSDAPTPISTGLVLQYILSNIKYSNSTHAYDVNYFVQGKDSSSQAYNFNGVNDYINTSTFDSSQSFAISLWMNAKAPNTYKTIFIKGNNNNLRAILWNNNGYRFYLNGSLTSSTSFSEFDTWVNMVHVFNGTHILLYKNGVQTGTPTATGGIADSNNLYIGSPYGAYPFNGSISNVQIFNRSLSSTEVAKLYQSSFKRINSTEWTFLTNESSLGQGVYNYSITAQSTTSQRTFTIDSTYPLITLTNIEQGILNRSYFTITGSVSDNHLNSTQISIYKNNVLFAQYNQTTNTTINYNITNLENAQYSYNVTSLDNAGLRSTTSLYNVTTNATPIIINPVSNQNVTEYLNITWQKPVGIDAYYNILIYNSLQSLIQTINSFSFSYSDANTYTGNTQNVFVNTLNITANNYLIDNISVNEASASAATSSAKFEFVYSDGTSLNSSEIQVGTDIFATKTFTNPNNNKSVDHIILWQERLLTANYIKDISISSVKYGGTYYNWNTYLSNLSIETYYVQVKAIGTNNYNYSSSNTTINILKNSKLNVTAKNLTGSNISSFTANFTDLTTGTTESVSTSNGLVQYDSILGRTYSIFIDASGYAYSTQNKTVTINYDSKNFTLYPTNSIIIYIYNENTLAPILQNVSVTLTDITNPKIYTGSTLSGNITFANLSYNGDTYEVKFVSQNYSSARYYRIVIDRAVDFLNAYLLPTSSAQNLSLCFYDQNGVVIQSLHTYEYAISNSGYILTEDKYTDVNGKLYFSFDSNNNYYYNYSSTEYTLRPFVLNPPQNSVVQSDGCNYDITLPSSDTGTTYSILDINGYYTFNNISDVMTFTYNSTDYTINNYSYTISKLVKSSIVVICNGTSTNMNHTFTCDLTGYEGPIYIQGVANDNRVFFGEYYTLKGLPTLFDNLDSKDAAFWAGLIMAIILFAGVAFGPWGTIVFGIAGVLVIFWLNLLTPLTMAFIIIDIIVSLIIGIKLRKVY